MPPSRNGSFAFAKRVLPRTITYALVEDLQRGCPHRRRLAETSEVIHATRSEFAVATDAKGNRTMTFTGTIEPQSVVIPFDLLPGEVIGLAHARTPSRAPSTTMPTAPAISLGAEVMNILLDD